MKIAVIRSIEIQKAFPYVKNFAECGHKIKFFYTHGEWPSKELPVEAEKLKCDVSCQELIDRIVKWGPDAVISLSMPDENSLRDSLIKEVLEDLHGIKTVMHPLKATRIMSDKHQTRELVESLGYSVAPGFYVNGDLLNGRGVRYPVYIEYILHEARKLAFPVIVKPLGDSLSVGMKILSTMDDFQDYLTNKCLDQNFIVESVMQGVQVNREVVGQDGKYCLQPPIVKWTKSSSSLFPFDHIRCCSSVFPKVHVDEMERMLVNISKRLDICGAVEFEMMYQDGQFKIIEINPRVSGTTTLGIAASGVNTYQCLINMAGGHWSPEALPNEGFFSVELPIRAPEAGRRIPSGDIASIVCMDTQSYNGRLHSRMLLQSASIAKAKEYLQRVRQYYNLVSDKVIHDLNNYEKFLHEIAQERQI